MHATNQPSWEQVFPFARSCKERHWRSPQSKDTLAVRLGGDDADYQHLLQHSTRYAADDGSMSAQADDCLGVSSSGQYLLLFVEVTTWIRQVVQTLANIQGRLTRSSPLGLPTRSTGHPRQEGVRGQYPGRPSWPVAQRVDTARAVLYAAERPKIKSMHFIVSNCLSLLPTAPDKATCSTIRLTLRLQPPPPAGG